MLSPVPVLLGALAVHIGGKVTDEGALIEGREIGAEEIVSYTVDAMMINLQMIKEAVSKIRK